MPFLIDGQTTVSGSQNTTPASSSNTSATQGQQRWEDSAYADTGSSGGTDQDGGYGVDDTETPELTWAEHVLTYVEDLVTRTAYNKGADVDAWLTWYSGNVNDMLRYVQFEWLEPYENGSGLPGGFVDTSEGRDSLAKAAWSWLQSMDRTGTLSPTANVSIKPRGGGGSGRGRGSGGGGPKMSDFDLDALAEGVSNMWRSYLLADAPNARGIAEQYVNAILANPEKKLEFGQFVLNKIRGTSRHKAIYQNKPEAMEEQEFMNRYVQTAQQFLRPENVSNIAIGGAMMGADPTAYRGLIMNQREIRNTAPWINRFEDRLTDLRGLFRG
jgi:hypothetical protein